MWYKVWYEKWYGYGVWIDSERKNVVKIIEFIIIMR